MLRNPQCRLMTLTPRPLSHLAAEEGEPLDGEQGIAGTERSSSPLPLARVQGRAEIWSSTTVDRFAMPQRPALHSHLPRQWERVWG